MGFYLRAACLSNTGRVRQNNEDNFYLGGIWLPEENSGTAEAAVLADTPVKNGICVAVFDGMGGEDFGETAAFVAARCLHEQVSGKQPDRETLKAAALACNSAVVDTARACGTEWMGATMAAVGFTDKKAVVCNLGDSRVYLLRGGELVQKSHDHVAGAAMYPGHKPPLLQHLGIDTSKRAVRPWLKTEDLKDGDIWLLCSDGITDMLAAARITELLQRGEKPEEKAAALLAAALEAGGRDNATAMAVCVRKEHRIISNVLKKKRV